MTRKIPPAIAFGLSSIVSMAALATPAHAEDKKAAQIHIRGSIVNFGETTLKVKTREGEAVDVALADGWTPPASRTQKSRRSSLVTMLASHPYREKAQVRAAQVGS